MKVVFWENIINDIYIGKLYYFINFEDEKFLNINDLIEYEEIEDLKDCKSICLKGSVQLFS